MKYLITGITGFAGPHLANLLIKEGHEVIGLIRCSNGRETDILDVVPQKTFEQIQFVQGDLLDHKRIEKIIKMLPVDGIFHMAAQSHPPTSFKQPIYTYDVNVTASVNLIESVSKYQKDCKFMFCSTSEVYGNACAPGEKIKEDTPLSVSNPYGASKAAIDIYMQYMMESKQIKGFITRAFSHTGTRRGKNFSISADAYQTAKILLGMQDTIIEVGNLDTVRVVIDVRDCVHAYYLLMLDNSSSGRVFNVCGNIPHNMGFYTDTLIELSGLKDIKLKKSEKYWRPIDINYQHGDTTALYNVTGWQPIYKTEQTLSELLYYWVNKLKEKDNV